MCLILKRKKIGKDGKPVLPPAAQRPLAEYVQPRLEKHGPPQHLQNLTDAQEMLLLSAYFNAAMDPNNKRDAKTLADIVAAAHPDIFPSRPAVNMLSQQPS